MGAILVALLSLPWAWALSRGGGFQGAAGNGVALIQLTGPIETVSESVFGETGGVGPVIDALIDARKSDRIRAIVLRINSPGGSAAASQEVHRAVLSAREAGKPVVVSMADVAASGGYYVAVAADRILANPATITGSIGVYAQFLNLAELAEEWGIKLETVKTGPYKDIGNPTNPLTDDERRVIQELVDDSLDQFVAAIAAGRDLSEDEVRGLADGRVYTGNQARELGLIDEFGGLEDAVTVAAELGGIQGEPRVVVYGRPRPPLLRYLRVLLAGGADPAWLVESQLLRSLLDGGSRITIRY